MSIWLKLTPSRLLSILNPVSLLELSVHDKLMFKHPTAVATRLDGVRGVGSGVVVGVGVAVGKGVEVGVGLGVGVGVGGGLPQLPP
jgi:hypothetical protein